MGLSDVVAALAVRRAHVLVVEARGRWALRVAVEQALAARGWAVATSPADADVLVVCGDLDEALAALVDRAWDQVPGPRARVAVTVASDVDAALRSAAQALLDVHHQAADARDRSGWSPDGDTDADDDGDDGDDDDDDDDDTDMSGDGDMDMGDMDMDMDMDMDDMDMEPDGIPLASGGPDRDGLEMDVLHVPLGPVMPAWPAGLVLRCSLQGDVVDDAEVRLLGAEPPDIGSDDGPARAADAAARLLGLAGSTAATGALRVRDLALAGEEARARDEGARVRRRVGRSRLLRWQLRGLGGLTGDAVQERGLPDWVAGDVHDRLLRLLDRAAGGSGPVRAVPVDVLPGLVTGLDLAAARLVVASLDGAGLVSARQRVGARG